MAENNNNQMNSGFTSNIGEENSLGFGTPTSGAPGFTPPQPEPQNEDGILGLTEEEKKDPNAIRVRVSDPSPVVVLFGAKTSGKTMALIRLTRYLEKMDYIVVPDPTFRPADDKHYERMCNDFKRLCHDNLAPSGTDAISFMLVKVLDKNGRPICQILEAPGEHYFDEKEPPQQPFPTYITNITKLPNRRVWVFFAERNWRSNWRDMYVERIKNMPANLKKDKTIFICQKVDEQIKEVSLDNGMPNTHQIIKDINVQYPGLFTPFENKNPITRFFKKYNFKFVPFSAGAFTARADGKQEYTEGEEFYPKLLWKAILKTVKG